MSKVVLYIAVSLDGFIADAQGGVEWLNDFQGEDYGYADFLQSLDAVIMGTNTYEQVLGFGMGWPYAGVKTYVVTHRPYTEKPDEQVIFYNGDVKTLVEDAKNSSEKDIWLCGGASLVSQFIQHNLIDEYNIAVMPIVLGSGIPLFNVRQKLNLTLKETKSYSTGVVQLIYNA